ncbi:hypothetical protein KAFR_0D00730 [Kazachstania africana CBS 2517]|uniref:Flo11 domain-containing protein n=1 Tax=Kazachstania africana (strain ATCC 22294 / BCRC 22015 / CBS 2517 / CECT 1963 / NBRC 1671 / NRRL Y-8276) TaxID=1071382 RepID=H2ATM0_KAZAF|nr:hypothetical protein KAFR_0D00730 [Kazachstania africana CBS 2517]CCF57720.1 hypothetical protein KAFR_0D00730 [Kazachstania africana CBS 2517]
MIQLATLLLFLLRMINAASPSWDSVTPPVNLAKREEQTCGQIINGCPDLNFTYHEKLNGIMDYDLSIDSVVWTGANTYNLTVTVTGQEAIALKYLWSLKLIGVQGPESTIVLYGKNENTYLIDDPTHFTVTFEVYAEPSSDNPDIVWMPNFEIKYEYLQGDASQYSSTWEWGTATFTLITGCYDYDNQCRSETDFPGYFWSYQCDDGVDISDLYNVEICGTSTISSSYSTLQSSSTIAETSVPSSSVPSAMTSASSSVETGSTSGVSLVSSTIISTTSSENMVSKSSSPLPSTTVSSTLSSLLSFSTSSHSLVTFSTSVGSGSSEAFETSSSSVAFTKASSEMSSYSIGTAPSAISSMITFSSSYTPSGSSLLHISTPSTSEPSAVVSSTKSSSVRSTASDSGSSESFLSASTHSKESLHTISTSLSLHLSSASSPYSTSFSTVSSEPTLIDNSDTSYLWHSVSSDIIPSDCSFITPTGPASSPSSAILPDTTSLDAFSSVPSASLIITTSTFSSRATASSDSLLNVHSNSASAVTSESLSRGTTVSVVQPSSSIEQSVTSSDAPSTLPPPFSSFLSSKDSSSGTSDRYTRISSDIISSQSFSHNISIASSSQSTASISYVSSSPNNSALLGTSSSEISSSTSPSHKSYYSSDFVSIDFHSTVVTQSETSLSFTSLMETSQPSNTVITSLPSHTDTTFRITLSSEDYSIITSSTQTSQPAITTSSLEMPPSSSSSMSSSSNSAISNDIASLHGSTTASSSLVPLQDVLVTSSSPVYSVIVTSPIDSKVSSLGSTSLSRSFDTEDNVITESHLLSTTTPISAPPIEGEETGHHILKKETRIPFSKAKSEHNFGTSRFEYLRGSTEKVTYATSIISFHDGTKVSPSHSEPKGLDTTSSLKISYPPSPSSRAVGNENGEVSMNTLTSLMSLSATPTIVSTEQATAGSTVEIRLAVPVPPTRITPESNIKSTSASFKSHVKTTYNQQLLFSSISKGDLHSETNKAKQTGSSRSNPSESSFSSVKTVIQEEFSVESQASNFMSEYSGIANSNEVNGIFYGLVCLLLML